ncbi:hypothetical protein [Streptomyces sp. SID5643]|uniref:hypothetical protein n=1 Tax=Streptomyces sp. SID5643 TaxID=2690307 RepID=UPI00136C0D4F|nr:hypothetical protein [Streptomyces sp. SID5643]MZF87421.1 hypothetical protein [Streptomyces sp. SID5643]
MTGFLSALGSRLAERWVSLLAVPGLLYTVTAFMAVTFGWLPVGLAGLRSQGRARLSEAGVPPSLTSAVSVAFGVGAILLVTAGAGLLAQAVAGPVERACCGAWPGWARPLEHRLTERRSRRWSRAHERVRAAAPAAGARRPSRDDLVAARNAIALVPPGCPTWTGDRLRAVEVRVRNEYGLDLYSCWPRLWLVVPDTVQEAVRTGRDGFSAAVLTGSWAVLYVALAPFWWPVLAIAAVLCLVAWRRVRTSAAALADLTEAVFDVHAIDLAAALRVETPHDRVTPEIGRLITERLRKGT